MNILFLTILDFSSLDERGIYTDLLREFIKNGHNVCVISPSEKRKKKKTEIIEGNNYRILKLRTGNIQKTNIIEKGISTILIESLYKQGIKKYYADTTFDLILFSTPPITLLNAVKYVKTRDNAKAYLLLKDIFPQNAVDLGIIKKHGLSGLVYKYFRNKEKLLYKTADYIGCMSPANVDYLLKHNNYIKKEIVEVCPNSIDPIIIEKSAESVRKTREKFNIPLDKTIFVYGGNIGKPQGVDFIIECLRQNMYNENAYFVIAGAGTEFYKMKNFVEREKPVNVRLFNQLIKNDYELLINACDVGLVFLDKRFTIPNFPSRILSYMQASMPVLAATDRCTDLKEVIQEGEFGFWCESGNVDEFKKNAEKLCNIEKRTRLGINSKKLLEYCYSVNLSYNVICKH